MQILDHKSLPFITGGSSYFDKMPNAFLATAIQAVVKPRNTSPANDEHGDEAPLCTHYHAPIAPKNGDRNALGQQYSWGAWWDDTH